MMMSDYKHPLSQEEFDTIYAKVPRLTVEIIIKNDKDEIFLTQRAISYGITAACQGKWHLPGGTVRFGELLVDAVKRIALRETGITVEQVKNTGYIEITSHSLAGMDYPVGIVFEVLKYSGSVQSNDEAADTGWFSTPPDNLHEDIDTYLLNNNYLTT